MASVSPPSTLADRVQALRTQDNEALDGVVREEEPVALYEPVRYVLAGEGKRLRPVLLLLTAEALGAAPARALPAALALEVFHNFTLVHDDIMDHAPERRGRPTVHQRWDVSTALLAGDLLMARSYDLLTRVEGADVQALLHIYHRTVRRLCEGQAMDKAFETCSEVSVEDYMRMIDSKTGALLAAALELGGCVAGAQPSLLEALQAAGLHLGRAYQIRDDLLDLTADDARWGKPVGGDLVAGKKTFLLLRALERAAGDERRWFARAVDERGLSAAEVPEAHRRMDALGVLDEARAAVRRHSDAAQEQLQNLPDTPAADTLRRLVRQMQERGD